MAREYGNAPQTFVLEPLAENLMLSRTNITAPEVQSIKLVVRTRLGTIRSFGKFA